MNQWFRVVLPLWAQSTCGRKPGEAPCLLCTHRKDAVGACACSELFKLDISAMLEKGVGMALPLIKVCLLGLVLALYNSQW